MNRHTLSALAVACLLPGCTAIDLLLDPQPKFKAADAMAVVPNDFLFTRYPPLNRWLDTPMRTLILDTPLKACFDHEALRGIRYQWIIEPKENPIINIDRVAITRRQLLWCLAQDHLIQMTPKFGPSGELEYLELRSRDFALQEPGRFGFGEADRRRNTPTTSSTP
jgi:hypothetical protein